MGFIGKQPAKAAITSSDITDGVVTADKLASNSVTTAKIADNGVTTAKINADAVTDAKIADDVVGTEHLTAGEVDTTALGADAVTAAKIADDAISDEHLDPTAITGQTAETSAADDDLILLSDTSASAALKKMTRSNFLSGVGGTNTPAFFASQTGDQTMSDATATKIAFSNEVYDTNNCYDPSTNYRFTPGFAGKSFISAGAWTSDAQTSAYEQKLYIYKNGSEVIHAETENSSSREWKQKFMTVNAVLAHDDDDYFEIYGFANTNDGGDLHYPTGSGNAAIFRNYFYGFKIIE